MSEEIQTRGGRRLFAMSLVLSAIGVVLVAWWVVGEPRPWWMLVAGACAAVAGVAMAARGRRNVADDASTQEKRGGR